MRVSTQATVDMSGAPGAVFDHCTHLDAIGKTFRGYGPVPAVLRAEVEGGGAQEEGATRRVTSADGSTLRERILRFSRPTAHEYTLENIGRPLSFLVREGRSVWSFAPEDAGTRVTWTYTFELTSPLALGPAALVVKIFMHGAMQRCLDSLRDSLPRP